MKPKKRLKIIPGIINKILAPNDKILTIIDVRKNGIKSLNPRPNRFKNPGFLSYSPTATMDATFATVSKTENNITANIKTETIGITSGLLINTVKLGTFGCRFKTPRKIAKTAKTIPKTNRKVIFSKLMSTRFRRLDLNATQASEKSDFIEGNGFIRLILEPKTYQRK